MDFKLNSFTKSILFYFLLGDFDLLNLSFLYFFYLLIDNFDLLWDFLVDLEHDTDLDFWPLFVAGEGENVWWFEISFWAFERINCFKFLFLLFDLDLDLDFLV